MKIGKISALALFCTAAAGAFSGLVYYEVMGRNATLYSKIADGVTGEDPGAAEKEENDERFVWFRQQKFEEHTMVNDRGQTLTGYLLKAKEPTDTYVLCSHGYRADGKGEFRFIAKHYHDIGLNVFIVDHQAAGKSEGSLISFGYYESKDIIKWVHYLRETFGSDIKVIMHGVSMGCATVTMASADENLPENVKFTVADCGYTSMNEQFCEVLKSFGVPAFPLVPMTEIWNRLVSRFSYSDVNPLEAVSHAKVPMLFIHGSEDTFVPTKMVRRLFDACPTDKDLLIVDGAIHARSYYVNGKACDEKIDKFIEKYI